MTDRPSQDLCVKIKFMILRKDTDSIAILEIQHGKVNALDVELCAALDESLESIERSAAKAIVLTGSGTTFSAGVDLFRLLQGGTRYAQEFVPKLVNALKRLFIFPKPVVVAINGNAIAGGCVIACACDYRVAIKGRGKIGVPEALVGVPFPSTAFEIVRFATDPRRLQEVVYFGRYYDMEEGVALGFVDETVDAEKLLDRAMEIAERLSQIPADTFRLIKAHLRAPYLATIEQSTLREEEIEKVWMSGEIHTVIRDYLQRTVGKK